jgi:hypothetical protein
VLGQRNVDARRPIIRGQILFRNRTGEDKPIRRHLKFADERTHHVVVTRHTVGSANEDEPVIDIDVPLVMLGQENMVLDLLVWHDSPDKQKIDKAIVQNLFERGTTRRMPQALSVDGDGKNASVGEPVGFELLPIELRVAKCHVGMAGQRLELFAAERGDPENAGIVVREEMRRRHIVVLQHPAARQPRKRVGHR